MRCFEASQSAALTVQRLQTGGKQHVVVQHVTVSQDGRAVVAGQLEGAVGAGGGVAKMGNEPQATRRGWPKNGNSPGDA
jgi:hypothetical protein